MDCSCTCFLSLWAMPLNYLRIWNVLRPTILDTVSRWFFKSVVHLNLFDAVVPSLCSSLTLLSHSALSHLSISVLLGFFLIRMMNWMDSLNTVCLNFNAQWDIMIIYQKSMVPIFTSVFNIGRIFWKATISITTPTKQH